MDAGTGVAERAPGFDLLAPGARHRYGAVFALTLVLLVFEILAPAEAWARATVLALQGAALVVVLATSRDRRSVRRARVIATAAGGGALVLLVAAGVLGRPATFALSGALSAAIAVMLMVGAGRLVARHGVTLEVVAGALAIYLLLGLLFSWVVLLMAELQSGPYFAGGQAATAGSTVYFSFTVLTTTGFGDYVAATSAGRAIAVVEMLLGQIYLVTVIGVLVGGFTRGRRA